MAAYECNSLDFPEPPYPERYVSSDIWSYYALVWNADSAHREYKLYQSLFQDSMSVCWRYHGNGCNHDVVNNVESKSFKSHSSELEEFNCSRSEFLYISLASLRTFIYWFTWAIISRVSLWAYLISNFQSFVWIGFRRSFRFVLKRWCGERVQRLVNCHRISWRKRHGFLVKSRTTRNTGWT